MVKLPNDESPAAIPQNIYMETLRQMILGLNLGSYELSVFPALGAKEALTSSFINVEKRERGEDWPGFAITMTGNARILTALKLIESIVANNITGDVMETGVWRGGTSIYMHGVLRALGQHDRMSIVCDSFTGLPPSTYDVGNEKNMNWDHTPFLEVSDATVKHNFVTLGLNGPNILFVKGFFSKTMAPLRQAHKGKIALLRLDGDMYESTVVSKLAEELIASYKCTFVTPSLIYPYPVHLLVNCTIYSLPFQLFISLM